MSYQKTYDAVKNLVTSGSTAGERKAAQLALDRLEQKYGAPSMGDGFKTTGEIIDVILPYKTEWERYLIIDIAEYLDLSAFKMRRKRVVKRICIECPEVMVGYLKETYKFHRDQLDKNILLFVEAYCVSALPKKSLPPSPQDDESALTEMELAIARSAIKFGKQNQRLYHRSIEE